jgi:hypothetical protein
MEYPHFVGIWATRGLALDPRSERVIVGRAPKFFLAGQLSRCVREPNGGGTLA